VQKRAMPQKVVATSEDYLWVQLILAREDEIAGDKWELADVAKSVVKAGRSAWDRSGQRPEGYFLVLILIGEYERVCLYLTRVDIGGPLFIESLTGRGRPLCNRIGMVWIIAHFIGLRSI
jgi:Nup93/Nic96